MALDFFHLPRVPEEVLLIERRPGLYCLRFKTTQGGNGLLYALTYKVFRHPRGNIFALTAHAVRGSAFISVYHNLPPDLMLEQAQVIAAEHF